jgi:hypothetical protein
MSAAEGRVTDKPYEQEVVLPSWLVEFGARDVEASRGALRLKANHRLKVADRPARRAACPVQSLLSKKLLRPSATSSERP